MYLANNDCIYSNKFNYLSFHRYNNDLELEDAIHTAILTLKVCLCKYCLTI